MVEIIQKLVYFLSIFGGLYQAQQWLRLCAILVHKPMSLYMGAIRLINVVLNLIWSCRIVRKWFTNGLASAEVAKGQDLSAIIIKEGKRLSANACLALELVYLFSSLSISKP